MAIGVPAASNGPVGSNGSNGGPGGGWPSPPTPPSAPAIAPPTPPDAMVTGQMSPVPSAQGAVPAANLAVRHDGPPVHIPVSSQPGAVPAVAPVARAFALIPEPEEDSDGGGAGGRNYVIGGNVLGIVLGIITVVALVWALVIALRTDNTPEALAARSSSNRSTSGNNSGAQNTDTSATGTTTDTATGDTTAAAGAAAADTSGAAAADSGAAAGGGSGAAAGGGFKFAPAPGTYAVTGTGSRMNKPPGTSVPVSNPSLVVEAAGSGCFGFKFTMDPNNWNRETICGTSDGGLVLTKAEQYINTTVGPISQPNTNTLVCSPPEIVLPANPAPGAGGAGGGTCIGTNSADLVPGKSQQTAKFVVVGKETVAGVPAWHVKRDIVLKPADSQNTQNGTMVEELWFSTTNGLILRWKENINATSVIAGAINTTYAQQLDLTLKSPNPS